ncbi:uncharacterized protein LOC129921187 isoform X2 [Episyrphus balteatus]|uniref:uncharacterized protein LOC129921187 isoform X2 n=1 Tax=Episyrphus balteatus TaxID=286459 RepID=UPI002486454C|nr:uncharacterized protein LOC129921187 isoform X2 [Episyrphus balteatus]
MNTRIPLLSRRSVLRNRQFILILLFLSIYGIFILLYFQRNEHLAAEVSKIQQTLTFLKPKREWNYSNTWQFIGDPYYRQQIYSAYFDPRTELYNPSHFDANHISYGSIRVFAVLPLRLQTDIICYIKYEDTFIEQVKAYEALPMQEHENMKFSGYTIMCPLRMRRGGAIVHLPESVAIIYMANPLSEEVPTYVPISYSKENVLAKPNKTLAICVGPLQQHYSQVLRMVEFIEIYRLLGADKFYFYRLEVTPEIDKVLGYYERARLAEVNAWNFYGYEYNAEVHYSGIMVQINECMYRATFVDGYKYVAVVDLDEILVPLKCNTLLDYLRGAEDGRTSAFVFRNVFFFKKGPNDTMSMPPGAHNRFLYTQVKVQRTFLPLPPHQRSKCIVNGRTTIEMGNHQVWRQLEGISETNVHIRDGLMFHYREKCIGCRVDPLIVDFTARRFGSIIWDQVDDVCVKVFQNGICPVD